MHGWKYFSSRAPIRLRIRIPYSRRNTNPVFWKRRARAMPSGPPEYTTGLEASAFPLRPRFHAPMKIIEHPASFEVQSDDGSIVRQVPFDDNASPASDIGDADKEAR